MNKILGFLRIPLVRFIGVIVILYFALFSNKENPDSLSNRLSKEQITKNLNEATEKSRFIISNVKTAQEISETKVRQPDATAKILVEDLEIGKEGDEASCGSEVEITYGIYDASNKLIRSVSSEKLIIGSELNPMVEDNVIGMKRGGIRNIKIPYNFKSDDQKLTDMLNFYKSDLRYQISVLSVVAKANTYMVCQ